MQIPLQVQLASLAGALSSLQGLAYNVFRPNRTAQNRTAEPLFHDGSVPMLEGVIVVNHS